MGCFNRFFIGLQRKKKIVTVVYYNILQALKSVRRGDFPRANSERRVLSYRPAGAEGGACILSGASVESHEYRPFGSRSCDKSVKRRYNRIVKEALFEFLDKVSRAI